MTISALLLEAMGTVLLFVAVATFLGIVATSLAQSFLNTFDSVMHRRVMEVYFWTLVIAAIATGLKTFSAVLLLDAWGGLLCLALTVGLIHWARLEWRKKTDIRSDNVLQRYYDEVRTGQIDIDEEWDKQVMMSSDNPSSP